MGASEWDVGANGQEQGSDVGLHRPIDPDPAPKDAMRSWLLRGVHTGGRRNARRVLGDDRQEAAGANGGWRELASALQRHTLHNALIRLDPEERHLVTLAYLQGRTNRQIAALLGISVSTVGRRLSQALDHIDEYTRRTRSWVTATMLLGLGYLTARAGRLAGSASSADWSHRVAATVAVATVAVVSVGLVATSRDSAPVRHAQASTGINLVIAPWNVNSHILARLGPVGSATTEASTAPTTVITGPESDVSSPTAESLPQAGPGIASNSGCHARPTDVDGPGTDRPEGPAVHLAAGGCQR